MKGKITSIVLCTLLLGLVIVLPAAIAGVPAPDTRATAGGGGGPSPTVFAGTYIAETDMFGGVAAFHTLSADGTMSGTNTNCCGAGGGGGLQGPVHGVWEKTGELEITVTAYGYAFNPDGSVLLTARITEVLVFDEGYETAVSENSVTELWFGTAAPDFQNPPPPYPGGATVPWGFPDYWTWLHSNVE